METEWATNGEHRRWGNPEYKQYITFLHLLYCHVQQPTNTFLRQACAMLRDMGENLNNVRLEIEELHRVCKSLHLLIKHGFQNWFEFLRRWNRHPGTPNHQYFQSSLRDHSNAPNEVWKAWKNINVSGMMQDILALCSQSRILPAVPRRALLAQRVDPTSDDGDDDLKLLDEKPKDFGQRRNRVPAAAKPPVSMPPTFRSHRAAQPVSSPSYSPAFGRSAAATHSNYSSAGATSSGHSAARRSSSSFVARSPSKALGSSGCFHKRRVHVQAHKQDEEDSDGPLYDGYFK